MRIAVSGASGLIGSAFCRACETRGDDVLRLVRDRGSVGPGAVYWRPSKEEIDADALNGVDAIVNLAGENIASGRWTPVKKAAILDSRVQGTRLLSGTIAQMSNKPRVFVSASAIGFYGVGRDQIMEEDAAPGSGFLADVCQAWESAADRARDAGVRVVHPRIGVVLAAEGGALPKMKVPFMVGLGGKLGDGQQPMSWIALDDVVAALQFVIDKEDISGPVNFVSPHPTTNEGFTRAMGDVLGRPTKVPVPALVMKLAVGSQLANEMLLSGVTVRPQRLRDAGFEWKYADLKPALRHALKAR